MKLSVVAVMVAELAVVLVLVLAVMVALLPVVLVVVV